MTHSAEQERTAVVAYLEELVRLRRMANIGSERGGTALLSIMARNIRDGNHWERWVAAHASADTLPKGQDAKQGLAGTESGAVPKADARTPSPNPSQGDTP
jgi:hypothetical protein